MKKDKIIYWITTGLVSVMMLFSGYSYFANPDMTAGFKLMGFPDFFRVELGVAKIIAGIVLLIPFQSRIKDWAYAGLGIVFISAAYTHISLHDEIGKTIAPLVFLGIMSISYLFYIKINKTVDTTNV